MPLLDIIHPDDNDGESLQFKTNAEDMGFEFKVSGENVQFDADHNMYTFMPSGITVSLSPNDGLNGVHVSIPGNIPGEPLANFVERWEDDAVGDRIVAVLNQLRDHPIPANNNSNENMDGGRYKKRKSRKCLVRHVKGVRLVKHTANINQIPPKPLSSLIKLRARLHVAPMPRHAVSSTHASSAIQMTTHHVC